MQQVLFSVFADLLLLPVHAAASVDAVDAVAVVVPVVGRSTCVAVLSVLWVAVLVDVALFCEILVIVAVVASVSGLFVAVSGEVVVLVPIKLFTLALRCLSLIFFFSLLLDFSSLILLLLFQCYSCSLSIAYSCCLFVSYACSCLWCFQICSCSFFFTCSTVVYGACMSIMCCSCLSCYRCEYSWICWERSQKLLMLCLSNLLCSVLSNLSIAVCL